MMRMVDRILDQHGVEDVKDLPEEARVRLLLAIRERAKNNYRISHFTPSYLYWKMFAHI
jgi:hypothetical protein